MTDTKPRQVATTIIAMPPAHRAEAMERVEGDWRSMVKHYLELHDRRVERFVAYVICGATRTERNRRIAETPADVRYEVHCKVVEIFEKRKEGKK